MEEDRLIYDCDGNCIPQYPRKKAPAKRRKFYKTSGNYALYDFMIQKF